MGELVIGYQLFVIGEGDGGTSMVKKKTRSRSWGAQLAAVGLLFPAGAMACVFGIFASQRMQAFRDAEAGRLGGRGGGSLFDRALVGSGTDRFLVTLALCLLGFGLAAALASLSTRDGRGWKQLACNLIGLAAVAVTAWTLVRG